MSSWKKSSFSNGSGGNNCVEVEEMPGGSRMVRSSESPADVVVFTAAEWDAFVKGVKAGEFD